jgi:hypothetical protein
MGETTWYRIVVRRRTGKDDALPARSGRFHEDPKTESTSYLGDSFVTVWKEAQAARAGAARVDPDAFRGWRLILKDAELVDLRGADARKKWSLTEGELLGDPAPPICREVARAIRRSKEVFHGILYRSVRHPPKGVCLALFLENRAPIKEFEPVSEREWKEFVKGVRNEGT